MSGIPAAESGMLERVPLRDQAIEVLRDLIVRGVIESGTRINEVELAGRLGISRGPLREAIQRLSAEGLVEFHRNRGAYVREITVEDVRHLYELRQMLEVTATKLAASRASDADIAGLEKQIADVDVLLADDSTTSYPADSDFHTRVLQLAKNPYLERFGSELQAQLRIARLRAGSSPERAREAHEEHRAIATAIAARDVRTAGRLMTAHLRNSLDRFITLSEGTE